MHPILTDRATAALALGLRNRDTINQYISRGWLSGHKIGRRWVVTRESIDRLILQGTPAKH